MRPFGCQIHFGWKITFGSDVPKRLIDYFGRFNPRDLADAILNPNNVISDQHNNSRVFLEDGSEQFGRFLREKDGHLLVMPTPMTPDHLLRIPQAEVKETKPSKLSAMMPGLINSMNPDEVLDLLAFLRSGVK